MNTLFLIIGSTFLVSLVSFMGVLFLFVKKEILDKILIILVSFSAGALIGGAFLHLLPEALDMAGTKETPILKVFIFLILGFCAIFIFEQILCWRHCHIREHAGIVPFSYSILLSDALHNFIDGLIIAGSFLASTALGITTTFAVILHEIPQEIGDYGVLVYGGFKRTRALFFNFLSAAVAIIGGVIGFWLTGPIEGSVVFLLSFAAGTFVYIASSDLVPEIKHTRTPKQSLTNFSIFLLGLALMLVFRLLF